MSAEEVRVTEGEWQNALSELSVFTMPAGPVIFVAPHPDDETLAAGGLLAALAEAGTSLIVVAVTDGDAAYDEHGDPRLASLRCLEQTAALARLGVSEQQILRLGLPDRNVEGNEARLTGHLVQLLEKSGPDTTLIAPWSGDFHSDHEAAGRSAEAAAMQTGTRLVRWIWWGWHRRSLAQVKSLPLRKFHLEPRWFEKKLIARSEHTSQLGEEAILPEALLLPVRREFEVFA